MSERALVATRAKSFRIGHLSPPAIALGLLAAFLLRDVASLFTAAHVILGYRYNIDYVEGIVWQQMINIAAGRGYAPVGVFPAIVYHYPPVYHLVVAGLSSLFRIDPLITGRLVSLSAAMGSAAIVGALAHRALKIFVPKRAAGAGALFAACLFPLCLPVAGNALTMRVDMLACLFSIAGLWLAILALRRPRLILLSALSFVLAVYTKQVSVAAPAAAIVALLVTRPRIGWTCLAACIGLGLAALAVLTVATDGGFLRHIILYNINRNLPERLWLLAGPLRTHAVFVVLAAIGVVQAARSLRTLDRTSEEFASLLILLLYLGFKTPMLAMIVKSGGSTNYLIEWFAIIAIFAAIGIGPTFAIALGERRTRSPSILARPAIATALLAATALQAVPLAQWGVSPSAARAKERKLDRLVAALRHTAAPVISDDMTLIVRAGRPVLWEPSIAAELASVGRYDEPGFVAMIRARCFAGFITDGDEGDAVFDSRYNPPVAAAMDDAYPRRFHTADLTIHLPPHGIVPNRCEKAG